MAGANRSYGSYAQRCKDRECRTYVEPRLCAQSDYSEDCDEDPASLVMGGKHACKLLERDMSHFKQICNVLLECYVLGSMLTNCYLVACEKTLDAMIIDPEFRRSDCDRVLRKTHDLGLRIRFLVNTHGHIDHTGGNRLLKELTSAQILVHEKDSEMIVNPLIEVMSMPIQGSLPPCPRCGQRKGSLETDEKEGRVVLRCDACGFTIEGVASPEADRLLHDNDVIELGTLSFEVLHTLGHSPGSISLYVKDQKALFSGDTLFRGRIGSTQSPLASRIDLMRSVQKLMNLPDDTTVYPGHGEKTTIGMERKTNPYIPK